MLEELGWQTVAATNGEQALATLARDQRIEVLISNIDMPGMDGFELMTKATQMHRGLHVLGLSGWHHESHGFPMLYKPFCD